MDIGDSRGGCQNGWLHDDSTKHYCQQDGTSQKIPWKATAAWHKCCPGPYKGNCMPVQRPLGAMSAALKFFYVDDASVVAFLPVPDMPFWPGGPLRGPQSVFGAQSRAIEDFLSEERDKLMTRRFDLETLSRYLGLSVQPRLFPMRGQVVHKI